ncbi:PLC-like phosphodiesterase, TIM beta/alpha-barrel domain protein [Cordyceps fumosorosea ARSEF 2679]|uniref:PLC-like phosphodiesterase, TIM beta/alpha-barrel domain protein n=1 Tax=Cordyceps fumosorosea (strain ARSEF 2679) TaxID=1081104 RepID=A0A167LZW3_CORFA|nr:PLC-like phosphodiesterase, TIM beta/alpha-barrel domain protein [Cordyceps fumosorosea ARSEF 2679]OAA53739.1 PLC-like phosphodiesterase, TIM beta/alpha-barrel domain protein [Cordyceps fumosorosea ARSEF 2679]
MLPARAWPLLLLLPPALACDGSISPDAYYVRNGLTWTEGAVRMNEVQVVGTHNSYHVEADPKEQGFMARFADDAINFRYSHSALDVQLEYSRVRSLELDILADPDGGNYAKPLIRRLVGLPFPDDPTFTTNSTKVLHVPDLDVGSVCASVVQCLRIVKRWLDAHPRAVPIPILLELKTAESIGGLIGGAKVIAWNDTALLDFLDAEIRSVFPHEQLILPDDLRREDNPSETLEGAVLRRGWPDLDSARGRAFFLMDNGPVHPVRSAYIAGRPNLEGRMIFTNAAPGDPDCAFQKHNEPVGEEAVERIRAQVAAGYWVRTRADVPLDTVLRDKCETGRREAALRSGAQVVSTDFPAYGPSARWGCDYAVRLPGGRPARCNPVSAGRWCDEAELEPGEYSRN